MVAKRLIAAVLGFGGGGALSMILFALLVSVFDLDFQTAMPGALTVAVICGIVGLCFPALGTWLFLLVDWWQ